MTCRTLPRLAGRVTVQQYAEQWLEEHWTGDSRDVVAEALHHSVFPHLGTRVLAWVQPADIRAWVGELEGFLPGLKYRYRRMLARGVVCTMFDAAVRDGLIVRNPCRTAKAADNEKPWPFSSTSTRPHPSRATIRPEHPRDWETQCRRAHEAAGVLAQEWAGRCGVVEVTTTHDLVCVLAHIEDLNDWETLLTEFEVPQSEIVMERCAAIAPATSYGVPVRLIGVGVSQIFAQAVYRLNSRLAGPTCDQDTGQCQDSDHSQDDPPADLAGYGSDEPLRPIQVARALGVGLDTVYREIRSGRLAGYKVGRGRGYWLIPRLAFRAYLRCEDTIPVGRLGVAR